MEQTGLSRLRSQPLVACRQSARLSLGQRTGRVRVPAATRVAFRHDEYVLGQRREQLVAERAAVGRGLAVLSAANGPPARRLGHCARVAIVPPDATVPALAFPPRPKPRSSVTAGLACRQTCARRCGSSTACAGRRSRSSSDVAPLLAAIEGDRTGIFWAEASVGSVVVRHRPYRSTNRCSSRRHPILLTGWRS